MYCVFILPKRYLNVKKRIQVYLYYAVLTELRFFMAKIFVKVQRSSEILTNDVPYVHPSTRALIERIMSFYERGIVG